MSDENLIYIRARLRAVTGIFLVLIYLIFLSEKYCLHIGRYSSFFVFLSNKFSLSTQFAYREVITCDTEVGKLVSNKMHKTFFHRRHRKCSCNNRRLLED